MTGPEPSGAPEGIVLRDSNLSIVLFFLVQAARRTIHQTEALGMRTFSKRKAITLLFFSTAMAYQYAWVDLFKFGYPSNYVVEHNFHVENL